MRSSVPHSLLGALLLGALALVPAAASADSLLDNPNVTEVGDDVPAEPADDEAPAGPADEAAPDGSGDESPGEDEPEPSDPEPSEPEPSEPEPTEPPVAEPTPAVVDPPAEPVTSTPAVSPTAREVRTRPSTPAVRSGRARAVQLAQHLGTAQGAGILLWSNEGLNDLTVSVALTVPSVAILVAQSSGSPRPGQMTLARAYHDGFTLLAVETRALTGALATDRPDIPVSMRRTGMVLVGSSWVGFGLGMIVAGRNPDVEEATGLRYESAMYWSTMAGSFLVYPFVDTFDAWSAALMPFTLGGLWLGHALDARGRYDGRQLGGITLGGAVGTTLAWLYYGLTLETESELSDGSFVALGLGLELAGAALGLAVVNPLTNDRLDPVDRGFSLTAAPTLIPDGAGGTASGIGLSGRW